MRTIFAFILGVAVVGSPLAAAKIKEGVDGYKFSSGTEISIKQTVYFKRYDSQKELEASHDEAVKAGIAPAVKRGNKLNAWSALNVDGSCTIHTVDPNESYRPEHIGHELMHCYYGAWH